ncbi:sugar ABC transporter permease [Microbacterium oryzae]|uniref:carbohydrate ABC transporter permease n=1 Tax=Microbacterium oryzae TaxID=743009 RepID=UPI0025AF7380|nr:sugar ABC transporter permease [Microbacterium oryzae]MDN3311609.1 sugar ABC transporter permease [Microbacterium oryzae]
MTMTADRPSTRERSASERSTTGRPQAPRRRARPERTLGAIALVPFVAFLLVFALYPLAELLRLSVTDTTIQDGAFVSRFNGLENFATALTSPANLASIGITIVFIVLTVGGTLILGTALALLVDRAVWTLGIARNVLIWPAVITPVVVSVMWVMLLSPTVGGINKVLLNAGLPAQGWLDTPVGAFLCVVVVDVWHWTPIVFLFVYTALRGIGGEILEAARMDGASEWQVVGRIVLPMLAPALVVVSLVRLVSSIKAFDEMYLLTRGGPDGATNLVSLQIRTLFFDRLDFGPAAALSVAIVLAVGAVVGGALLGRRTQKEARA